MLYEYCKIHMSVLLHFLSVKNLTVVQKNRNFTETQQCL